MSTVRNAPAGLADHVDALPPGTRLGEFEITSLLGVGGFGMVYQAFDHSLLRFVAIKEYMPAALAGRSEGQSLWVRSSSDAQSFQAGLASFVSEARLLAQFDHPSLVKVFRFWEANSTAYMVMPLYSGMTLKQARAHMRTPPPEDWLRKVLWSVTSALRVLHDGETLHRDISPDNIFLQDAGPPVLLDLGAARRAIRERDGRYTAVLKVNYAPIEQYAEAGSQLRQGPWTDLYSLGAVVHGCLCNDAPLPATLRAIRDRMVSFPRVARTVRKQFGVDYSRPFVDAVSQCLALQPQDRPQSIDVFLQAMELTAAPADLEHFDFRAELGDVWVEPSGPGAPGVAAGAVVDLSELSQPQPAAVTLPSWATGSSTAPARTGRVHHEAPPAFAETVAADWSATTMMEAYEAEANPEPEADPDPDLAPAAAASRSGAKTPRAKARAARPAGGEAAAKPAATRTWLPWALSGFLLLVLVGAWQWNKPQPPRYTPESEIITEVAPQAEVPTPVVATFAPVEETPAGPVREEEPAFVEQTAASAAAASSATAAGAAQRGRAARVQPLPAAVVPEAAPPPPAPAPAPAPRPPAPRPAPAPQPTGSPETACASASFLTRPMCVHQECQKAAFASHPVCVAARQRREEEARQRQMLQQ